MTPIKQGTAARLGLRKPHPLGAYRQRYPLGISMADIEAAWESNPNLKALREWAKVDWPDSKVTWTENLDIAPHRP